MADAQNAYGEHALIRYGGNILDERNLQDERGMVTIEKLREICMVLRFKLIGCRQVLHHLHVVLEVCQLGK